MGTLHFRYPKDIFPVQLLRRSFFTGWGKVPLPSKVILNDDILTVSTDSQGSGTFFFPWPHKRLGLLFLATDTLRPRESPYLLLKELVRGQLGRIIRRFVELVYYGFKPPAKLRPTLRHEVAEFAKIATANDEDPETEKNARLQLERLLSLCTFMVESFLEQSLTFRQTKTPRFPVCFGIHLDHFFNESALEDLHAYTDHLRDVFHVVNTTPSWKVLEPEPDRYRWDILEERILLSRSLGFSVIAGPILEFHQRSIPDWIAGRMSEEGVFERFALKYLDTFLEHFAKKVDLWVIASQINTPCIEGCNFQRVVNLVKRLSWVFENRELSQPGLFGVDQPWGDYLQYHDSPFSPMGIAEVLGGLPGVHGILLELNIGISSRASYPRDPMLLSMMIDQWSSFGKPLYLSLGIPSELGRNPDVPEEFISSSFPWSKKTQQEWVHRYLPVLFCKRSVSGIFWNLLEDSPTHEFSSTGLFDTVGRLKPALQKLTALRKSYVE